VQAPQQSGDEDREFGRDGSVEGTPQFTRAALMPDGRMVTLRLTRQEGGSADVLLSRLLANGSPDPAFGTGGSATLSMPDTDVPQLAVMADGRIVLGLTTPGRTPADLGSSSVTVMRLNADGAVDASFGTAGRATFGLVSVSLGADAVGVQPSGAVVVASEYSPEPLSRATHLAFTRFTSSGKVDRFFGLTEDGRLDIREPHLRSWEMAIGARGEIVIAGNLVTQSTQSTVVRRVPQDGAAEGRRMVTPAKAGFDSRVLALDDRGAVLVGGSTLRDQAKGFALARFTSKGLDQGFGRHGIAERAISGTTWTRAMAVQPDGRLLLAGSDGGETTRKRLRVGVPAGRPVVVRVVDGSGNEGVRRLRSPACD
jgi:uncharacterized delta-60 repeat protein